MQGSHAYRKNALAGWSRIEMLLAIYDNAIASFDAGIDFLSRKSISDFAPQQIRTLQLLVLLLDGINADSGEVARNTRDLCVFCIEQASTADPQNWRGAREVLVTLREGFRGIREEAIQLEATGQIPGLTSSSNDVVAVL